MEAKRLRNLWRNLPETQLVGCYANFEGRRSPSLGRALPRNPPPEIERTRSVRETLDGMEPAGDRTGDLLAASQTLSQLSYGPGAAKCSFEIPVTPTTASTVTDGTSPQRSSSR